MQIFRRPALSAVLSFALLPIAAAQTMQAPDITKDPTLYVVPYAHLDTQWRWEFPQVISEYLLKTMRVNFDYIDKYPHYVFNWTGANRYRLMKEYFPNDYARMKEYIAKGRWFPAGSSMEEGDVNLPSAEGIIRQVLYGNTYFRNEFGKASNEYMLPDCFGFPASLPSILAHAGVKGFSTQKLSAAWQPAPKVGGPDSPEKTPEGIPYNVGLWIGTDGKKVIAALNPESYGSDVYTDLSEPTPQNALRFEQDWVKRIELDGQVTGVYADYHYVGTGDIGGAPQEPSVKLLEAIVDKSKTVLPSLPRPNQWGEKQQESPSGPEVQVGNGPVHVIISAADQMFNDIKPEMTSRMPTYRGDLELINHSAGSLTSEAYHKRWIRENEVLGAAAEEASVMAAWMGGRSYPQKRLNDAWTLVMGGHFHDTAAGTATPLAYQFAWNDDIIALNQFATVLTDAAGSLASRIDTQTKGTPVLVYNPMNIDREDLVEATVSFPGGEPKAVRVRSPQGEEMPAQIENGKVLFVAKVPATGFAVYDVEPARTPAKSSLKVTDSSIENARYRVRVDQSGDIAGIFDKSLNRELVSAPMRLAISTDRPTYWPAWNMDFDQEQAAPRAYVGGPAQIRIAENGPARVALEITREAENSKFVQTVSLSAGEPGDRVEFHNAIDWKTLTANLKATFPLAATNKNATYNWDIGTVQRPNAMERQFEVASHRWIDLTDNSGAFGATILTGYKNGSDKPNDNTIRLTLVRSPGMPPPRPGRRSRGGEGPPFSDQANQDWGHHEIAYALLGHKGNWRDAQVYWQGYAFNEPLIAFNTPKHPGPFGKHFSLLHVNNPAIRVMALKKAETSDEVILRLVEASGESQPDVRVSFAAPVASAREVNGQELPVGDATLTGGALQTSFTPYQPRTFALKLGRAQSEAEPVQSVPVSLNYDVAAASNDDTSTEGGGFDGQGNALPAEMLPAELVYGDVRFQMAPAMTGAPDALATNGQRIPLPSGEFNRLYILAAAYGGDQAAPFQIGDRTIHLTVEDWGGFIGQWDTRLWKNEPKRDWAISASHASWPPPPDWPKGWEPRYPQDYVGLAPGFIKPASLAWYASHHHTAKGLNEPYQYSYLFAYPVDVPQGTRSIVLPKNEHIRIFAISAVRENPGVSPAQPLFDDLHRTEPASPGQEIASR